MAPSPTCLSCNRPFPRNGELASLPEGRRIAFDPGQRRVWRICTKCGEWNLLGVEAAGAALAELSARDPKPSTSVRSTRVSGDLELVRIDDLSKVEVGDLVMTEQRDGLQTAARLAPWMPLVMVVAYAVSISISAATFGDDIGTVIGALLGIAAIYGIMKFLRIVKRLRYGAPVTISHWAKASAPQAAYLLGLWLLDGSLLHAKFLYLGGLPALLLVGVIPWRRLVGGFLPQQVTDVTLTEEWDAMAIRWTVTPPAIALKPLGDDWLSEADSARVLATAVSLYALKRMNAAGVQHAHALSASLGLSGVLTALDEWRRDRDDTLTLADIPAVYLVALQLAFSRDKVASKKALAAHEKLLEAGVVASEAERLDRPPEGA